MIQLLSRKPHSRPLVNPSSAFFFFNDTATTEIYTLSLHDALPIYSLLRPYIACIRSACSVFVGSPVDGRSEEHTSELQSQSNLVCRLLLEKKNNDVALGGWKTHGEEAGIPAVRTR